MKLKKIIMEQNHFKTNKATQTVVRTKITLIIFAFSLISCGRIYTDRSVKIKNQWRGKSVLQGSYIIKTKKDIPANFPKMEQVPCSINPAKKRGMSF